MTWEDLLAYCLAKPGAWQDEPWEGDIVVKVGSRIFAFLGAEHGSTKPGATIGLKCGPTRELADEWLASTEGNRVPTRGILTKDRDREDTYTQIVEFPSYEQAMQNSSQPETTEFAANFAALCDGPPVFRNLDVVRDEQM